MPGAGDPQNLNRYSYVRNNPLRYRDPSGHYLESPFDLGLIAFDLVQIAREGMTPANAIALMADMAGLALPGFTGGGPAARGAVAAVESSGSLAMHVRASQAFGKFVQFMSQASGGSSPPSGASAADNQYYRDLGTDPQSGYHANEEVMARNLHAHLKQWRDAGPRALQRLDERAPGQSKRGDWIYKGQSYEGFGGFDNAHFDRNPSQFLKSIDENLKRSGIDYWVVDVSKFTKDNQMKVIEHILNNPMAAKVVEQKRIILLGG